ncbi:MAG: PHP domain-containing protein [Acidimicrobiia bacterium]
MPVDLHVHSNASDGVDAPSHVMELAAAAGLSAVALVDHDTFAGIPEARATAKDLGITFVSGVELSVEHDGRKMHMLVYFVDAECTDIDTKLAELRAGRTVRNEQIARNLVRLGYDITIDEVLAEAKGPSVGRPHFADVLVAKGYFSKRDEVFEALLHDGGAAYAPRERLTATEAIELANATGGVAVIAHPATIAASAVEYDALFADLAAIGLGGIEAYHSMHTSGLRQHLAEVAASLGLAATGGSDYHGVGKRDYRIGVGRGDLSVPESALEELQNQRNR